jgi:hypothetical protein
LDEEIDRFDDDDNNNNNNNNDGDGGGDDGNACLVPVSVAYLFMAC